MNFKKKSIKSKAYILINYLDKNEDMFIDRNQMILKSNIPEIQKEIFKCYIDDDYFSTLSDERRNEIYQELIK